MCRFSGFTYKDKNLAIENIRLMNKELSRGGPDDDGIYIDENICLGHRRLSIIDLSGNAHQPMVSEDGNYVIVYNGELYNFRELKEELKKRGYFFKSDSDTEVILKSFIEWRESCFKKFKGMFAFSIYDRVNKILYLVRDQSGIKPLYYSINKEGIIFSSEIRGIKKYKSLWKEEDDWKIYFLLLGFLPEPYTTLKDVFMLPYGSYLRYDIYNKKHIVNKYSEYDFNNTFKDENFAIKKTRELIENSVRRHLISDAPLGVFLSGGVDSSIISILASSMKDEIVTLSITFDEEKYDESFYQEIVKNKVKSRHYPFKVGKKDFLNHLDDILNAMDQPTFDGVNTYFVSMCAKNAGLKSVLSGLGGDELFGGYPSFRRIESLIFLKSIFNDFSFFEKAKDDRIKRISYLGIKNPLSYYLSLRSVFTTSEISSLLGIEKKYVLKAIEKIFWDKNINDFGRKNFVSYLEMFYMRNQLLKDSDFMSMWNSIEIRVPFLDYDLMNFVLSIDEKIKFKKEKYLLKECFKDILPFEIVNRRKKGFSFPMKEWLKDFELKTVNNNKILLELLKKNKEGRVHWTKIWSIFILLNFR